MSFNPIHTLTDVIHFEPTKGVSMSQMYNVGE